MRRSKREVLCSRFTYSLVDLPTSYSVLHELLRGCAASALLQSYVEHRNTAFCSSGALKPWFASCRINPAFWPGLRTLLIASVWVAVQEGACTDMVGPNSRVLGRSSAAVPLTLLDATGIVAFERMRFRAPALLTLLMDRQSYLADLAAQDSK
jgi:hypothetical protein